MRIFLTNDDGIQAPGIKALWRALTRPCDGRPALADELLVVAPSTVQSGTGHGITFDAPLMVESYEGQDGYSGYSVGGRPADCTKLGLLELWPEHIGGSLPDLVVSGMNAGSNVGVNVIYSGTVAAAIEAAFLGLPAIAVSLHLGRGRPDFDSAALRARRAIDRILDSASLRPHECLNVNIPATEYDDPRRSEMPSMRVCPMNAHGIEDAFLKRESPRGGRYYWMSGGGLDFRATDDGSDVQQLFKREITVTPLRYDLTRHEDLESWRSRLP